MATLYTPCLSLDCLWLHRSVISTSARWLVRVAHQKRNRQNRDTHPLHPHLPKPCALPNTFTKSLSRALPGKWRQLTSPPWIQRLLTSLLFWPQWLKMAIGHLATSAEALCWEPSAFIQVAKRLLVTDTIRRDPIQGSPFLDRGTIVHLLTARINRQYVPWTLHSRKRT